ncbi:unnamed protein product [Fraxinus pennsylvanica]|uniref:Uncharacterized protein n=1 Tax=Fraxinus pennsylvanica TaxID=56036 RepID=A0AAD1ZXP9_9LAMI|nr:unnamed protein product [Fraxinus pennsylvanica]
MNDSYYIPLILAQVKVSFLILEHNIMANVVASCLFFILLIASNQVLGTQGRNLMVIRKSLKGTKETLPNTADNNFKNPMLQRQGFRFLQGYVDSFKPTTPGHSPGIGHSKHD